MESYLITARYGSVPFYKLMLRGAAWLLAFAYAFGLVYSYFATQGLDIVSRLLALITGILFIVVFLAVVELFSAIVDLLLDLEDHTRRLLDSKMGEQSGTTPRATSAAAPPKASPPPAAAKAIIASGATDASTKKPPAATSKKSAAETPVTGKHAVISEKKGEKNSDKTSPGNNDPLEKST